MLGPYHLDAQQSMYHLARVLRLYKDAEAAERSYWVALAVSDNKLGLEHPDTLVLMSNLAATRLAQDRHAEAKELYRRQLEHKLKSVDWDDPDLFATKFNLVQMLDKNEELRVSDKGPKLPC